MFEEWKEKIQYLRDRWDDYKCESCRYYEDCEGEYEGNYCGTVVRLFRLDVFNAYWDYRTKRISKEVADRIVEIEQKIFDEVKA